jgi:hypothetical protein
MCKLKQCATWKQHLPLDQRGGLSRIRSIKEKGEGKQHALQAGMARRDEADQALLELARDDFSR